MTPHFAAAVDPVFLHVLGVLDRISRNEAPDAREERELIKNWLRNAESQLGQKSDWELAKYAFVSWIDDVFIDAPWEGRTWWRENALEVELFKTRDRATTFYTKAKEAAKLTRRDALEVFYVCVVLGFRGLYREKESAFLADQLNLPATLESWAGQTSKSIELGQGRPRIDPTSRPGNGAPPMDGKFSLMGVSLMSVILTAASAISGYLLFFHKW